MKPQWKRRFTWIEMYEVEEVFVKEPFPKRSHQRDLGPLRLSISRYGVINPIIARVRQGKLQVICGYRRWLAAQVAGIDRIPVVVTKLSDGEALSIFREEQYYRIDAQNVTADETEVRSTQTEFSVHGEGDRQLEEVHQAVEQRGPDKLTPVTALDPVRRETEIACLQLENVYERIRRERRVPDERVREIADAIRALAPMSKGFDPREVDLQSEDDSRRVDTVSERLARHSMKVAILAQHVSNECMWTENGMRQLCLSALLHDVGMLFIPDEWIRSTYPLTERRKEMIKTHTRIGMELIQSSRGRLEQQAIVARDHHERWDGTGYPQGRKGRAVGLPARLIGLLDSYTAMVSPRPYRAPYLLGEALNMMREAANVGIYEPVLVKNVQEILSSCPIGMWGRLPDDSIIRVQQTRMQRSKSHRVEVQSGSRRYSPGEEIWFGEDELLAKVTEIPPFAIRQAPLVPSASA